MDLCKSSKRKLDLFNPSRNFFTVMAIAAVQITVILNVVCYLHDRWGCVDDRIFGAKTIISLALLSGDSMAFVIYGHEFSCLIDLFDETAIQLGYKITKQQQKLLLILQRKLARIAKIWNVLLVTCAAALSLIPAVKVLTRSINFHEDFHIIIKDKLSTPYPLYYPKFLENFNENQLITYIFIYLIGYSFQVIILIVSRHAYALSFISTFCSLTKIEYELKHLILLISEIEGVATQKSNITNNDKLIGMKSYQYKYNIQCFFQLHQDTYRKFNVVRRGIRWVTLVYNIITSLYLCFSLYEIIKKDELTRKSYEALFFCICAYAMYTIDVSGERIKTEDENLRNALYECSWLDKPKWFKTSLLIAITRCNRPMNINPFGLFALNLQSFAKTMNAAYSYYNVMNNL